MFCIMVMTAVVCGFMACGNSKAPATEQQVESDSVEAVETTDTATVDTSVVTRGGTESEGFGRCLESGCYCKAFKGRGQTCQNCGHAYKRHY